MNIDPEIIKKIPQRNQGGMIKIGEEGDDDNISDMIALEGFGMIVVKRKSVWKVLLADDIDPKRNNPDIPRHIQEKILSYGSNDLIVGRTLLQGKEFFLSNHLPNSVDTQKGMQLVLSFVKEIAAMSDEIKKLEEEYKEIHKNFTGKLKEDGSLVLPVLKNIERRTKELIQNIDHAGGMIIDALKLFPIQIPSKNPLGKLIEETEKKFGETSDVMKVLLDLKEKAAWFRYLRSDVEHPDETGSVSFENYSIVEDGKIKLPCLKHTRDQSPFHSVDIIKFAVEAHRDILDLFETVLSLLCDLHAEDFAGDKVFIRNLRNNERTEVNPHMNYKFDIQWTK